MSQDSLFDTTGGSGGSGFELDVRAYLGVIWRYRWHVLAAILLSVSYTTYSHTQQVPVFSSTARLLIQPSQPSLLGLDQVFRSAGRSGGVDATQLALLQSRAFIERVIESQGLLEGLGGRASRAPDVVEAPRAGLVARVRSGVSGALDWLTALVTPTPARRTDEMVLPAELRDRRYTRAILAFRGSMRVTPVAGTDLVDVSWRSTDPVFATQMANAIANEFVTYNVESQAAMSQQATDFVSDEISRLREEIQVEEVALQDLADELGIEGSAIDDTAATGSVDELASQHAAARADRVQKEAVYRQMQNADPSSLPEVRIGEAVRLLRADLTRLRREFDDASRRLTSAHPRIQELTADIADVESRLASEERIAYQSALQAARDSYEAAARYETRMRGMLETQRQTAARLGDDYARFQTLRTNVLNKRRVLDQFLQRQEAVELSSRVQGYQGANIRVVDPATLPLEPSGRGLLQGVLTACGIGLLAGAALAFVLDYVDNTLRSADDVSRRLGLTTLASVTSLDEAGKGRRRNRATEGYVDSIGQISANTAPELIAHEHPRSTIAEEYRGLRTALLLSTAAGPPKRLLVTSSQPGEGKTTTAVNLAASMAHAGKKVLLVDGDMRRPRLASIFGYEDVQGLANYLAGSSGWRELVLSTPIENLWVLPSGPIPPNPAELFASNLDERLLAESTEHFDIVIVDSPPVLTVVDPLILAPEVDGIVLVVKARSTPHQITARARKKLEEVRARVLGVVLNQVSTGAGQGYYYAPAYYYGKRDKSAGPGTRRAG